MLLQHNSNNRISPYMSQGKRKHMPPLICFASLMIAFLRTASQRYYTCLFPFILLHFQWIPIHFLSITGSL
ncbi:hypothetical protein EUGRSUZ_H02151 [Eucalyptus grandis]|uniref:Uncharacterized protein n=2 Tax=Eucalyptus grandis TaxID=71139 RepID=A0ACC3JQ90_EUCGR|nr:hypothetical protein EUGRSUZ_H02151 [Eucalyptus grandis]